MSSSACNDRSVIDFRVLKGETVNRFGARFGKSLRIRQTRAGGKFLPHKNGRTR